MPRLTPLHPTSDEQQRVSSLCELCQHGHVMLHVCFPQSMRCFSRQEGLGGAFGEDPRTGSTPPPSLSFSY